MLCYHKEVFALGMVSALFLIAIATIFQDVINKWFEEFKKFIGVK